MRRLYRRIYMHFLVVLVIVGLATSAIFASGWKQTYGDIAQRLARHAAQVLDPALGDPAALDRATRSFGDTLGFDVTVFGPAGEVLARRGQPLPRPSAKEAATLASGRPVLHDKRPWFVAAPIRDGAGALRAVVSISAPQSLHSPTFGRPILIVAIVLLIVGMATVPLARRISRPVEKLTEASRRFGAGDLSTRVQLFPKCDHEHRGPPWRRGRHYDYYRHHRHRRDELLELMQVWNDMAERIERLVVGQKELLANVSHELRSPLARIRVALELLPSDPRLGDIERDLVDLDRLIEDVLTTSRLEATGLPARLAPVDVGQLLRELAARAGQDPAVAGREVTVDAPPALEVIADAGLLRRAVWNLVENAAKYGAPPIALAARDDGAEVEITVTDQGEGIPPADRERVLEPFYRADKARTPAAPGGPPPGFGLGLTLARKVAEVHGGRIVLEAATSAPAERGLRVKLLIPKTPPTFT